VLETTVGPPSRTLRLTVGGESIVATRGHRFWVNGRGWEMTKSLDAAQPLHAMAGPLSIDSIEPDVDQECHNLIVDEFHTFFVGKSRLLVHDKSCPQPTTARIPGEGQVLRRDVPTSSNEPPLQPPPVTAPRAAAVQLNR
jgi:hypothetical protein